MTTTVTPETFWNAFEGALKSETTALGNWTRQYESDPLWTGTMMQVLRNAGRQLSFADRMIYNEYFRLDMTWFNYPDSDFAAHLWNLEVAIEHENHSEKWYDEWVKLSHICCGLKVLITYHDYYRGKVIEEKMKLPLEMYRRQRYKPPSDSWLIIFGPTCQTPRAPWVGYTFDGSQLTQRFKMTLT